MNILKRIKCFQYLVYTYLVLLMVSLMNSLKNVFLTIILYTVYTCNGMSTGFHGIITLCVIIVYTMISL